MSVDRTTLKVQLRNLREWRLEYFNGTPLVSDAIYDDVEDQVRAGGLDLPDGDPLRVEIADFLAGVGAPVQSGGPAPAHWLKAKHTAPAGSLNKAQTLPEFKGWHSDCLRMLGKVVNPFILGAQVRTFAIPNPSTDWMPGTLRRFGVDGIITKEANGHGQCFEVEHADDKTSGWYEPRELEGPNIVRGVWSEKLDGVSILLYYVGGHLKQAITRGDGAVGEDITRNVLRMKGVVPFVSGFDGDIRGEIILTKSDHAAHFPTYANPRNAASGIAKRIDGQGSEHLTVVHYRLRRTAKPISTKVTELKVLERIGAKVPNWGVFCTADEANTVYQWYVHGSRARLDYDIDGLVFEVDNQTLFDDLGELNSRPRAAVAFKFPHDQKTTILRDIQWQVGNTGRITPVAIFDEVLLAGARVTNASLHNLSNIAKILQAPSPSGQPVMFATPRGDHFVAGDQILVSRRNDVIPGVEAIVQGSLLASATPLLPPTTCPACSTTLTRDGEYLVCPNNDMCSAQISGAVKRWVAGLGLKGWGDAIIDALCDGGWVSEPADLYALDAGELAEVEMSGRRIGSTADTILAELNAKGREIPLHVFVGSLNIPLCSRSTCQTIADAGYDSLDKMRAATDTEIAAIPGMGAGRGQAFTEGLVSKASVIDKLLANGVKIKVKATGTLTGKSFCFTGFRDGDLEAKIEGLGGAMKSSAVKGLTYLVAQDPSSNSGKAQKARAQGTTIIGVDEAWDLAGGRG